MFGPRRRAAARKHSEREAPDLRLLWVAIFVRIVDFLDLFGTFVHLQAVFAKCQKRGVEIEVWLNQLNHLQTGF